MTKCSMHKVLLINSFWYAQSIRSKWKIWSICTCFINCVAFEKALEQTLAQIVFFSIALHCTGFPKWEVHLLRLAMIWQRKHLVQTWAWLLSNQYNLTLTVLMCYVFTLKHDLVHNFINYLYQWGICLTQDN